MPRLFINMMDINIKKLGIYIYVWVVSSVIRREKINKEKYTVCVLIPSSPALKFDAASRDLQKDARA